MISVFPIFRWRQVASMVILQVFWYGFSVMKRIFALRARGSADIRHHFSANSYTPNFVAFDVVPRGGQ